MTRRTSVLAGLALGLAVSAALFAARHAGRRPSISDLAQKQNRPRPAAGRLSLLPEHFPPSAPPAPPPRRDKDPEPRGAEPNRGLAEDRLATSVGALQERATQALIGQDPARAVAALERAIRLAPDRAELWSDLAAAYLERASAEDRPLDEALALGASMRATGLDPRLPQAAFNWALALTRLHLRGGARKAWGEAVPLQEAGWAKEAAGWMEEVDQETPAERWSLQGDLWRKAVLRGESAAVASFVEASPGGALDRAIRDLAGTWAGAVRDGRLEEAERHLAGLEALAAALQEAHHDFFLADSVAAAKATLEGAGREVLLRGLGSLAAASSALARQRYAEAEPDLARAEGALAAAGSPLSLWAAYHRGICEYYRPDYPLALRSFADLDRQVDAFRYPELSGLARWMLGTVEAERSAGVEPLRLHQATLEAFERAGDRERQAGVHSMFATAYDQLGQARMAWRHRGAALALIGRMTSSRRQISLLGRTGDALVDLGELEAALAFHDEAAQIAGERGSALERVVAYHSRGRVRSLNGHIAAARADLDSAWQAWDELKDPKLAESAKAEILRSEAELPLGDDPLAVAAAMEVTIGYFERSGKRVFLPEAYGRRAAALRAAGDDDGAETAYRAALDEIERQRGRLSGDDLRVDFAAARKRERIVDDLVALLADRGDPDGAFAVAERGKGRALLDRLEPRHFGVRHDPSPELIPGALGAALPEGTALLFYVSLEDRLLAWVISQEGVNFHTLPARSHELTDAVSAVREAALTFDDEAFARAAETLHGLVLAPLTARLGGTRHLVVVPDKALHLAPFAALRDADGTFLVERFDLTVAPAARLALRSLARGHDLAGTPPESILAVGEPAIDSELFDLPRLPAARGEVVAIAAVYPVSSLLLGAQATRASFTGQAGAFDVLHFAGHAIANPESGSLSSLLLAPTPTDTQGGVLYANQIAVLDLAATRLVVLGACDTGTGPIRGGEGVVSLARAFLAAGAPAVVQTLWKVDDRASAALLTAFHARVRAGDTPAAALRAAQLGLLRDPDPALRVPSAWAGYEVVGG